MGKNVESGKINEISDILWAKHKWREVENWWYFGSPPYFIPSQMYKYINNFFIHYCLIVFLLRY